MSFLEPILGLDRKNSDLELGSLAPDPYHLNGKIATLCSSQLAAVLGPRDRWQKLLSHDGYESGGLRKDYLTLDLTFCDFTPLSAPVGDHDFE
jgi:hypothetical protein